jgi:hypothetical protein
MIRPVDRPVDERGGMDYLGPEFLTWLWWRASAEPEFKHADGTAVYVHVDEYLELRGERAAARKTSLRAGMPAASAEGKVALRGGKVVSAARLILARGEEETTFTLRGEDLDVSSARLKAPEGETSEERLAASLSAARRLYDDLDLCFRTFLSVRCGDAWETEADRIRTWAAGPSDEERSFGLVPEAEPLPQGARDRE